MRSRWISRFDLRPYDRPDRRLPRLAGMNAAPAPLKPRNKPRRFLFRINESVGDKICVGRKYGLALLLFGTAEWEVEAFMRALHDRTKNFEIVDYGPIRRRQMTDLLLENPFPVDAGELCLDYLSPLDFVPADRAQPAIITSAQWLALMRGRLQSLFGMENAWEDTDSTGMTIDAGHWHKVSVAASSRSSLGRWRIVGNRGPLFASGQLQPFWPMFLLAQEIPLGDAKIGGGAMNLSWRRL